MQIVTRVTLELVTRILGLVVSPNLLIIFATHVNNDEVISFVMIGYILVNYRLLKLFAFKVTQPV